MMADPQFFHFTEADRKRIGQALEDAVKTGTGALRISAPRAPDDDGMHRVLMERVNSETMRLCGWDVGAPRGDQTAYFTSTPAWKADDFYARATSKQAMRWGWLEWLLSDLLAEHMAKHREDSWQALMYGADPDAEARQHAIHLGWPPECIGVMRGMRIITTEQLARMFPSAQNPRFSFDEELQLAAMRNARMQERAAIKRRDAETKHGQQASLAKLRRKKGGY